MVVEAGDTVMDDVVPPPGLQLYDEACVVVAVSVAVEPAHIDVLATLAVGVSHTHTDPLVLAEQPLVPVTVTVYVVFVVGDTVIELVVAPVLHK